MKACIELDEYLAAIRDQVCTRCVERPPGGPPCHTLGKSCGIELHLPELIDAVHAVHSDSMLPYEASFHHVVCEQCPVSTTSQCPCPLDLMLVLAVQAIESVDERHNGD